jgi:hypothetical protein
MKRCIPVLFILCLFGCTEDDVKPIDRTVHMAGVLWNSCDGGLASYWKDSVHSALTSTSFCSQVYSMSVDGSTVLISGAKYSLGSPTQTLLWRNGSESVLEGIYGPMIDLQNDKLFGVWLEETFAGWVFHKNGSSQPIIDTAYSFGPMAMAVDGEDVYAAGSSFGQSTATHQPPSHAQYWKNGQLIFRENTPSSGLSIFIHENDVYMAGILYPPKDSTSIACYWKNGQLVGLTDGNGVAIAKSIFISGSDVYAAGMLNGQAVYWKNGDLVQLTTTATLSMANCISVQGRDAHVGGFQNGHPAYWKNGVLQNIQNQEKMGQIKFIVVGSN